MAALAHPQRDTVEFEPNVPVQIALKYAQGKVISTRNGERVMFTTVDGRVMFLDPPQAEMIEQLGVNVREPFLICKKWSGRRGDPVEWTAWLSPEAEKARAIAATRQKFGNQPDGTFVAPAVKEPAAAEPPSRQLPQPPAALGNNTQNPTMRWAQYLLAETNALTDVYAEACKHADTLGVSHAAVRTILLSSFIHISRNGGCDAR
ncbi:MAG TPA: hypothetical protein VGH38_10180 [Bryobacteraceae bacterium]|jgi:hypothetical protein